MPKGLSVPACYEIQSQIACIYPFGMGVAHPENKEKNGAQPGTPLFVSRSIP
jgi:hypothetical protein